MHVLLCLFLPFLEGGRELLLKFEYSSVSLCVLCTCVSCLCNEETRIYCLIVLLRSLQKYQSNLQTFTVYQISYLSAPRLIIHCNVKYPELHRLQVN